MTSQMFDKQLIEKATMSKLEKYIVLIFGERCEFISVDLVGDPVVEVVYYIFRGRYYLMSIKEYHYQMK